MPTNAVRLDELRPILAGHPAFAHLSDAAIASLAKVSVREFVPAGSVLLRAGVVPSAAFIIERGRIRVHEEEASRRAGRVVAIEFARGDVCAFGFLVARLPAPGAAIAMRDSTVIRLGGAELLHCVKEHPELVVAQARQVYELTLRSHATKTAEPRIITLMPMGAFPIDGVVGPFVRALSETDGAASALDWKRAEKIGGAKMGDPDLRRRISEWCSEEDEQGRTVVLVCDHEETPWTRWCLAQTDRIVVAAHAHDLGAIAQVRLLCALRPNDGVPIAVDVLLVHEPTAEIPAGTRPWMDVECRRRHHHVRLDRPADFRRAARRIGERSVGVVLGGGGARALAHIGVLQALEDAGVPIDVVGGTSMGAVVAAGYACGRSPREMLELFAEHVPNVRALRDLDFPRVALFAGRKLDRVLQFAFEELDASDAWRPFFCVSADLLEARMVVHDRGPLWKAVRASCSLPGVFPPMQTEDGLLVDGGVVNNVPIDVMEREHACSTIIAIDVGAAGIGKPEGGKPSVGIVHVLTSATMLGSKLQLQHLVADGHASLFLVPPVKHIKLLGFDARQALYDIGYENAQKHLAEWDGLAKVRAAHGHG